MTRLICAWLLLGWGVASAQTLNYETPAPSASTSLTPSNVMWAAFALDLHADKRARAHDYLRVLEPQRHASNMHDAAALDAEAAIVEAEIDTQLSTLKKPHKFIVDLGAVTSGVEGDKATLAIVFDIGMYDLETNFGSGSRYFPPLYELLIANRDHYATFTLDRGVATEYAILFRDVGPQTAYLRVEMELVSLQQAHRFQTIVRSIKWYRDAQRTVLLSEKFDKRPAAALIKSRMLSEGITFNAAPEHAYTVADERILESLIENYPRKERVCKEEAREREHRVFVCQLERAFFGKLNARAVYRYVGGRLVEVLVYKPGSSAVSDADRANILHAAQYEHMGMIRPTETGLTEWSFGSAEFSYNPAPLLEGASDVPFYRATALAYRDLKAGKPGTEVIQ
jgi:hypothetical protein